MTNIEIFLKLPVGLGIIFSYLSIIFELIEGQEVSRKAEAALSYSISSSNTLILTD